MVVTSLCPAQPCMMVPIVISPGHQRRLADPEVFEDVVAESCMTLLACRRMSTRVEAK